VADRPELLEIGRIARPHGIKGDVIVALVTDRLERVATGATLQSDRGPLTIVASQPYQGHHLVTFAEIVGRDAAEKAAGLVLRAEPIDDPDALWVHDLIGARVVDTDGIERGRIISVEANPAHDILVLDTGGLVPVVFVRSADDGVVLIDPPDGLFDL